MSMYDDVEFETTENVFKCSAPDAECIDTVMTFFIFQNCNPAAVIASMFSGLNILPIEAGGCCAYHMTRARGDKYLNILYEEPYVENRDYFQFYKNWVHTHE